MTATFYLDLNEDASCATRQACSPPNMCADNQGEAARVDILEHRILAVCSSPHRAPPCRQYATEYFGNHLLGSMPQRIFGIIPLACRSNPTWTSAPRLAAAACTGHYLLGSMQQHTLGTSSCSLSTLLAAERGRPVPVPAAVFPNEGGGSSCLTPSAFSAAPAASDSVMLTCMHRPVCSSIVT